jgi:hypothetical protein
MTGDSEIAARQLVKALHAATEGQSHAWRRLSVLKGAPLRGFSDANIQVALDKGWVLVESWHSVCLTDEGRRPVKD